MSDRLSDDQIAEKLLEQYEVWTNQHSEGKEELCGRFKAVLELQSPKWRTAPLEWPKEYGWYFCRVVVPGGEPSKHVLKFKNVNGQNMFTEGVFAYPPPTGGYVEWLDEGEDSA